MTEQKQTSGETSVLERTIPERAVHDQVLKRVHDGVHGPSVLRVPEPNSPAPQQGNHMKLLNGILINLSKQKGLSNISTDFTISRIKYIFVNQIIVHLIHSLSKKISCIFDIKISKYNNKVCV